MKLLFVYNPHSGVGRIKTHLSDILEIMVRAGYEVCVHPTQDVADATQVTAERASDYDLVVCCGGHRLVKRSITTADRKSVV